MLKRLRQIEKFKKYTLSGIYDREELDFVRNAAGKFPVVRGIDLMQYSPVHVRHSGIKPDDVPAYVSDSLEHGFVLTASVHWCPDLPGVTRDNYNKSFYDMSLADHVASHTDALVSDIDAFAEPLKQIQRAGLPVLWRPLHEVTNNGAWFWWSRDATTFKFLWNLMYERLVSHHGLDNLLWVWNPGHSHGFDDVSWYPGDGVVHVTAIDYPDDPRAAYRGLKSVSPSKPAAVAEISWSDWEKFMGAFRDAPFCYVVAWANEQGAIRAGEDAVRAVYADARVRGLPWK